MFFTAVGHSHTTLSTATILTLRAELQAALSEANHFRQHPTNTVATPSSSQSDVDLMALRISEFQCFASHHAMASNDSHDSTVRKEKQTLLEDLDRAEKTIEKLEAQLQTPTLQSFLPPHPRIPAAPIEASMNMCERVRRSCMRVWKRTVEYLDALVRSSYAHCFVLCV